MYVDTCFIFYRYNIRQFKFFTGIYSLLVNCQMAIACQCLCHICFGSMAAMLQAFQNLDSVQIFTSFLIAMFPCTVRFFYLLLRNTPFCSPYFFVSILIFVSTWLANTDNVPEVILVDIYPLPYLDFTRFLNNLACGFAVS